MDTTDKLTRINLEIGVAEDRGDTEYFERLLASAFAMRRANGALVDRVQFLKDVAVSGPRSTTIDDVSLLGDARALVTCHVKMGGNSYHNLRLFIREGEDWELLAWANESAL